MGNVNISVCVSQLGNARDNRWRLSTTKSRVHNTLNFVVFSTLCQTTVEYSIQQLRFLFFIFYFYSLLLLRNRLRHTVPGKAARHGDERENAATCNDAALWLRWRRSNTRALKGSDLRHERPCPVAIIYSSLCITFIYYNLQLMKLVTCVSLTAQADYPCHH